MVGKPRTQILIWDFPILGGTLNVYNVLSDYINLRERLQFGTSRFFLRANPKAVVIEKFFMGMHLGKMLSMRRYGRLVLSLDCKGKDL